MYELSKYGTRGYKIIDCSPLWVFRPESPVKVFDWSPIGGTISPSVTVWRSWAAADSQWRVSHQYVRTSLLCDREMTDCCIIS